MIQKTLKILFAEDHEMVRNGIKLMLKNQPSFTAEIDDATDGIEALFKAQKNKYDVILLDINLPLKSGIEISKALQFKNVRQNILFLSVHHEAYVVKEALKSGALGYILKNSSIEELIKAILRVSSGERYLSSELAHLIEKNKSDYTQVFKFYDKYNVKLTNRELTVLQLITKGFTDKEIADMLEISPRTAGNHRYNLISKFSVKNSTELAAEAVKKGLI